MENKNDVIKASKFRLGYGCYQWWANRENTEFILEKLGLEKNDLKDLEQTEHDGETLYCVYVGSASKKDIMTRLNKHINGKNRVSNGNFKSISTLRLSIAAVYGYDIEDDEKISDKLCEFYLSWIACDKNEALKLELKMINNYFRPLNVKDHEDPERAKKSVPKLIELRDELKKNKD